MESHNRTVPSQHKSTAMEIDTHANALLRHRLFPRAMAWTVQQTATSHHHDHSYNSHRHGYAQSNYASNYDDRRAIKSARFESNGSPTTPGYAAPSFAPSVDSRERLFRTIGKWLDQRPPEEADIMAGRHYSQPTTHQFRPREYERRVAYPSPHYQPSYGSGSVYDMVKLHQSTTNSNNNSGSPTASCSASSRSMSISSHASPTHSQSSDGGASKKRQRGPTGSTAPSTGVARPGMSTSSAKRCSVTDCGKIAVSKGLCRGHGGGRRCTFAGCTKCAQSRSPFCWAHGGGKRCEAPNCRRSRKTKRFCVDHVEMETTVPVTIDSDSDHHPRTPETSFATVAPATHSVAALHLPSLTDALKRAVPAAIARATRRTATLPQSRDRLWPVPQVAASFH